MGKYEDLKVRALQLMTDGFVLVPSFLSLEQAKVFESEAMELVAKARRGEVQNVRIYDDYPKIFGGLNISGVEHPLPHLPQLGLWLSTSTLTDFLSRMTGKTHSCELVRLHVNNRFKWRGFWHRDADKEDHSIVAVIYLRTESGFRLLGKSASERELEQGHFGHQDGETTITAQAGDLLLFDASLWHRGHSVGPRLHVHLRFDRAEPDENGGSDWTFHLTPSEDSSHVSDQRQPRLIRWLRLVAYFTPSRSRSSIFQRP